MSSNSELVSQYILCRLFPQKSVNLYMYKVHYNDYNNITLYDDNTDWKIRVNVKQHLAIPSGIPLTIFSSAQLIHKISHH